MITKAERRIVAIVMAAMTCTATVSTTGLAVYAEDNPASVERVESGKQYETTVESAKNIQKYRFSPEETGTYRFYSTGNEDTYGYVYDADQNMIASDNDSGEGLNFSIDMELKAGEEYYLAVGYFLDDQTGKISWTVEQEDTESRQVDSKEADDQNDSKAATEDQTAVQSKADAEQIAVQNGTGSEQSYDYAVLGDGTVEITGYKGNDKNLTIPDTLANKKVSAIGKEAFFENNTIESATIPKSVTSLQYQSFASCKNLKNITFDSGSELGKIEDAVFYDDSKLEKITCPQKLQSIGENAFGGCGSLAEVELNDGLKEIGVLAFCGSGIRSIDIKDSVTNLEQYAFYYCKDLQNVRLGKGIKEIKDYTFNSCSKLKTIKIPENVTSIGQFAFERSGLTTIDIPDTVTSIGEVAFGDCKNLQDVTIGNGMAYVSESAFRNSGITNVKIGNHVKSLHNYAFEECKNLKQISIPENVTEIQYAVFRGCESLEKIDIPDTIEKIGGNSFKWTKWYANQKDGVVYAGKVLYNYKGTMPKGTTVTVKAGTKGISSFAFADEENLKAIIIPDGVTNIGDYAFHNCPSMTTISIPDSVKEIGEFAIGYKEVADETQGEHYSSDYATFGYHTVIPGFVIYGEAGSEAERYAAQHSIEFEKNVHTVIFKDGDTVISTQQVVSGEDATAPDLQTEGYTLTGWSGDYTNVKADITVTAQWAAKNGWTKQDGKWYYYQNGKKQKNTWIQDNGNYYYVDESGAMLTDAWIGDYYVDADGVWVKNYRPAKWMQTNGRWWYRNVDGSYPKNCWMKISDNWYRFDQNGYMVTGWCIVGNQWYYMNPSGVMQTKWQIIGGTWYYFNAGGAMITGWQNIDDNWYYMDNSGAMAAGRWIGNYYVEANGVMATNKWIGNYYVDNTGCWTKTRVTAQWMVSGNRWWYRHSDGSYACNGWENIGENDYLFDANGWMLTGWQIVNGKWYYLESSGAKATNKWVNGNYYVDADGVWNPDKK